MSALLPLIAQFGSDNGHMSGDWGWLAIGAMAAMMGAMGWMMWSMMRKPKDDPREASEDPIALLKRRYAAGELSTQEFHERLGATRSRNVDVVICGSRR